MEEKKNGKDSLLLKWGTVKGWNFATMECEAFKLLKQFMENAPYSAMSDRPDEERKQLLCKVIDVLDGEIQNDWTGEMLTKEQAKEYVLNYGK